MENYAYADLILHGGTIITMDPTMPQASALAIAGSHIVCVGSESEVSRLKGNHTKVINLKNSYVYPGFIETHMHVLYTGITQSYLQLHACTQKRSVIEEVQKKAKDCQKGEWIIGVGWDDTFWPDKHALHAKDLDEVAPHNPVVLVRKDTHLFWINTFLLQLAGINKNTASPPGGKIEKDAQGNPTGMVIDKAAVQIMSMIPQLDKHRRKQLIQNTIDHCAQMGITTVHNAATDYSEFEAFKDLALANELKIRVYLMGTVRHKDDLFFLNLGRQDFGSHLQLRCLKFWMDGALGSRGAALFESYHDEPDYNGLLLWNEDDFYNTLQKAKAKNFQVATHAIGDRANHLVLNSYEKVGVEGLRWRIEHAQQLLPADVKRFKELDVIAAIQPLHATEDMHWLENRLGKKRVESGAFLWKSLLDSKAMLIGGSDAPVASANPIWGMHAAITRQNHNQQPEGGWYPAQRVTIEDALKMYTIDAAYACFQEKEIGSIVQGKLADLVVLPKNLLNCVPEDLIDMKVIHTIVNGKIIWSSVLI